MPKSEGTNKAEGNPKVEGQNEKTALPFLLLPLPFPLCSFVLSEPFVANPPHIFRFQFPGGAGICFRTAVNVVARKM
jgi:hypothetical protein